MRRRAVLLVAVLLAVVAACAAAPERGDVVDKRYEPEHQYFVLVGKVLVPFTAAEAWYLTLRNGEAEGDTEVPRPVWEACQLGQLYTGGECTPQ